MTSAAMHLIGDDKGRLPEKRMERIGDNNLTAQTPGIMTPRRTAAAKWAVIASLIEMLQTQ